MKKTPMALVLELHPKAVCHGYAGRTFISFHIKDGKKVLGIADTVRGAWRAAAAQLRKSMNNSLQGK